MLKKQKMCYSITMNIQLVEVFAESESIAKKIAIKEIKNIYKIKKKHIVINQCNDIIHNKITIYTDTKNNQLTKTYRTLYKIYWQVGEHNRAATIYYDFEHPTTLVEQVKSKIKEVFNHKIFNVKIH